jgi:Cu2+-containing amine oxidase
MMRGLTGINTDPQSLLHNHVTPIESEAASGRSADASVGRMYQTASTEKTDRLGHPTSYALFPVETPTLLAADDLAIANRAAFATKHLWVTGCDPADRYAAGDFVNQHTGRAGLPAYGAPSASRTFPETKFGQLCPWTTPRSP